MRAQDPISEIGLTIGGHGMENRFWEQTLANLAAHLGVETPTVTTTVVCVDKQAPVVAGEERAALGRDPLDAPHAQARQEDGRLSSAG